MEKVKPIKWLMTHSKGQRLNMALLIIFNAIFSVLSVAFAFAIKGILDGAELGLKNQILTYSIAIVVIVILQFAFRFFISFLSERIRHKLEMDYKTHIFSQILKKKQDKISAYHSGELMNRLTADVRIVAEGMSEIVPSVVAAVTRLLCAVVALVLLDPIFALAFSVAGLLVFIVITFLRKILKSLHKKVQETDGRVRSFMQECIENILAVKVFSVDDKINDRAVNLQDQNFKYKMKRKNYGAFAHSTYNLIFSAGYLFALIYGAVKMIDTGMSFGALSAILQLVNNVQVPFMTLSNVLPKYYGMVASAERLIEIEKVENEPIFNLVDKDELYDKMQSIAIENLTFTYDRGKVLKEVNAVINKGEFVTISGVSGVGKSTLIKLLLGVYPIEQGRIVVKTSDGDVELNSSTRCLFSYVPQGNMIFSGSLLDNVTFINSSATKDEIDRALKISCAEDFISQLPNGINTIIGENGIGLSEGQIQRIAIARAILTNAPVMLLDEATSALDEGTEKQLLDNLKQLTDKTFIVVSHKKSALSFSDKNLVVSNGKIVEK